MSKDYRQKDAAPSGGLARIAALLGGFALFSRLLGLVRDMGMAWLLGGGAAADALVAAMRLPHVLRRLLGEGSLSMTLTASLVRLQLGGDGGPGGAENAATGLLARALSLRLGIVLILFTLVALAAAPWLAKALAPGFSGAELERTVFLLRLCLPYVLAAGMAALGMALLHSMGIFWLPALSPALFNMVMLLAAGAAALGFFPPAPALAAGMLCGGIAQWLAQWLAVRRLLPGSFRNGPPGTPLNALGQAHGAGAERTRAVNRAAWRCLRLLPGGVLGAAAPQLAMLAAMALASGLGQGQVAALYYAERLLELPLGLVGVCLGMASLPALSRLAAEGNFSRFGQHLSAALRLTLMLSLPAAAGLAALGPQLVEGLLGHGAFDRQAAFETGLALLAYVPGLPAFACNRSLLAACNALGLVRHTAVSALWTVGGTLVAGLALVRMLGPEYSILAPALAVSCGLWLQCVLLLRLLGKRLREGDVCPPAGRRGFWPGLPLWLPGPQVMGRHVLAGGLTGFAANALLRLCAPWGLWPSLLAGIAGGVAVWALVLLVLRDPDLFLLAGRLRKKPRVPIVDGSA
ncbi:MULTISPECIES: murein biosynthesis integral membrane protein MurJ [Desulfovibrio]|uniref:Probable lipid II flippase MurJ n=2 Tax=Desulfovibrio TaxID=872 RepID=A0AA94HU33_DESDE|nr:MULTISPECIES: murein biosynthesis integral membrane protein MurJ [Desulfovibrio]ATD81848.1 murein biosynthesis integral membrane protein MurJ [Desulfovibrio sp. G11]SFW62415.1 putative peptidoglycan lipid II flippase [Desulfovibrio desulfuricans]SPD34583.1 Probable lipid II flippase MurJ [Desulfovibrio sp. G11]